MAQTTMYKGFKILALTGAFPEEGKNFVSNSSASNRVSGGNERFEGRGTGLKPSIAEKNAIEDVKGKIDDWERSINRSIVQRAMQDLESKMLGLPKTGDE